MSTGAFDFFNDNFFKVIYSFHMPLFMLLSGYVSYWGSNKRLVDIILRRLRGVGIPLLVWGTFDYVVHGISSNNLVFSIGNWFHSVIAIWFLWAVLCASILVSVIHKFQIRSFAKYLIMILSAVIWVKIPEGTMIGFVYPYFVIGYAMNEFKLLENVTYKKMIQPICGVIWIVLLAFYKKIHFIYISGMTWKIQEVGLLGQITIDIYRYLIGLVGCIAAIVVMKWLFCVGSQKKIDFSIIERFGQHTLEIYILQRIILERYLTKIYVRVVSCMPQNIFARNQLVYDLCFTLLCALIIGTFVLKISEIISGLPHLSACLFGKGRFEFYKSNERKSLDT